MLLSAHYFAMELMVVAMHNVCLKFVKGDTKPMCLSMCVFMLADLLAYLLGRFLQSLALLEIIDKFDC
jgi:hypothetical protein